MNTALIYLLFENAHTELQYFAFKPLLLSVPEELVHITMQKQIYQQA